MKEINIKVSNISQKQWPLLLVELNLVAQAWKKYGPNMKIKAKNFDKIIKWGQKKHGDDTDRAGSSKCQCIHTAPRYFELF